MHPPIGMSAEFRVPPLIKRNTALFALSQTFTGAGSQFAYGLGPLMVTALTGSAALAGLSVGLIGLSRFLVSYPVGRSQTHSAASPASCWDWCWRSPAPSFSGFRCAGAAPPCSSAACWCSAWA